ncbi:transcription factor bHLH106-like [Typha latifolia]|uniref:transcription factor bHLH106-like n=1 Tax=Typha latifolia TaxID=4733 RepID=UPI003C2CBFE4
MYPNISPSTAHNCSTTTHVQTTTPSNSTPIPTPIPIPATCCFMASFYPNPPQDPAADPAAADRALIASHNHREAEKRRRERIKSHLDRLRAILACDAKMDKASLLAKAVERVRDLKQRMASIAEAQLLPTETDEIVVLPSSKPYAGQRPSGVFEASVCCDDRSDLLPELIETLRSLRLKTLRAEIATLGGRVRNVLVVASEDGNCNDDDSGGGDLLRDALKALVYRAAPADRNKRRKVLHNRSLA